MFEPQLAPVENAPRQTGGILLTVLAGPHKGKCFTFHGHDTFMVGRAADAQFSLPADDPYFSRYHFLIEANPPLCRLVDLKSKNGTQVNGKRVETADLHHGDEIKGGTTVLRIAILDPAHEPATMGLPRVSEETKDPPELETVSPPSRDIPGPSADQPRPTAILRSEAETEVPAEWPVIPGYRLRAVLGIGGMGVVYRALKLDDGAEVALKTILPRVRGDQTAVSRFLREARILQHLQHPHIVAFRDMGQAGEVFYFAMEYVQGINAGQLVRKEGPLSLPRALALILQVLDGLAYAHGQGFVHRDLKPANLLIAPKAECELAMIADFGLARAYQGTPMSALTVSGKVAGTPQYMPPEQVLDFRSVKPSGDQYAAAATLYFLLTGQPHFPRTDSIQAFYKRILQEQPTPILSHRSDLPRPLADAIHRALSREPEKRFADVRSFATTIQGFAAG